MRLRIKAVKGNLPRSLRLLPSNIQFDQVFCDLDHVQDISDFSDHKGGCHFRFSGIRPLRGYPPPLLTENQSEKKKVFFLSGKGGYPPPLNGKSAKLFREIFS